STVFLNAPNTGGQGLGNISQNSNSITLMGNFDMPKLYKEFRGYQKMDSVKLGRQREIDSLTRAYDEMTPVALRRVKKAYKFKHKYKGKDFAWMIASSIKRINFNYN